MSPDEKADALTGLYGEWANCERCPLSCPEGRKRRNIVFGDGNPDAKLVVIGDGPSFEDDKASSPFSGDAGEVVDFLLRINKASRDDVFLTNLVACVAPDKKVSGATRPPIKAEVNACQPRLSRILEIIDPFAVLIVGPTAFKALTSDDRSFSAVSEDAHHYPLVVETPGTQIPVQRIGFATYVPESLLSRWTEASDGKPARSGRVWRRALKVADLLSHRHHGTRLPDRGDDF